MEAKIKKVTLKSTTYQTDNDENKNNNLLTKAKSAIKVGSSSSWVSEDDENNFNSRPKDKRSLKAVCDEPIAALSIGSNDHRPKPSTVVKIETQNAWATMEILTMKAAVSSNEDVHLLSAVVAPLHSHMTSVTLSTDIVLRYASFITKFMTEKQISLVGKVLSHDRFIYTLKSLLRIVIQFYNFTSNETSNLDIIVKKIEMLSLSVLTCKSFNEISQPLSTFYNQLVFSLTMLMTKSHLIVDFNLNDVTSSIGNSLLCLTEHKEYGEELRYIVTSEILKCLYSNMNKNPTVPSIDYSFLVSLICLLHNNNDSVNDIKTIMRLYVSTHIVWSKNECINFDHYKDITKVLESTVSTKISCWILRVNILLAMRLHLSIEDKLLNNPTIDVQNITDIEYKRCNIDPVVIEQACSYVSQAVDVVKSLARSDKPLDEMSLSIICNDCRALGQLVSLQGGLLFSLLKYLHEIELRLKNDPLLYSRYEIPLKSLVAELRLTLRTSIVFNGLNKSSKDKSKDKDIISFLGCFEIQRDSPVNSTHSLLTDPMTCKTLTELNNWVELFTAGSIHLLHASEPLYISSDVERYYMCQLVGKSLNELSLLVERCLDSLTSSTLLSEKRSRERLYAFLCLVLSKIAHQIFSNCPIAFNYAHKAMNKVNQKSGLDFKQLHIESLLMLIDLYDQTGSYDLCEMHVAELLLEISSFPSLTYHKIVSFHLLRIWYRSNSKCIQSVIQDLLDKSTCIHKWDDSSVKILRVSNYLYRSIMNNSASDSDDDSLPVDETTFRYSHRWWVRSTVHNQLQGEYQSFLSEEHRKALHDFVGSFSNQENTITQISGAAMQVSKPALDYNARDLLTSCFNFDVIRTVRRKLSVSLAAQCSFASFIAGAGSVGVSIESNVDSYYCNNSIFNNVKTWFNEMNDIITEDNVGSISVIQSRITEILQQCNVASFSNSDNNSPSAAICFVALEPITNCLLLGRADSNTQLVVSLPSSYREELISLSTDFGGRLEEYKSFRTYMEGPPHAKRKLTKEQNKEREKQCISQNAYIEETVNKLHCALGPWRIMLCGRTKPQEVARSLAKELSNVDNRKNKVKKGKPSAASQNEEFKFACKEWIEFILYNTNKDFGLKSADMLSIIESRDLLRVIVQCWNKSVTLEDAELIATGLLEENGFQLEVPKTTGKSKGRRVQLSSDNDVISNHPIAESLLQTQPANLILLLDETVQSMPWESMPCLRGTATTRMPNLALLLSNPLLPRINNTMTDSETHININVDSSVTIRKAWLAVDTLSNLKETQEVINPFFKPYTTKWEWPTCVGEIPSKSNIRKWHEESSLFLYCGHGAGDSLSNVKIRAFAGCPSAMLWGCSSGRLQTCGVYDPVGPALNYLLGGGNFVIGNLWDVHCGDIDRLTLRYMKQCLPDLGTNDDNGDNTSIDIASSLVNSRKGCKMMGVNGYAPVVYGINQHLKDR